MKLKQVLFTVAVSAVTSLGVIWGYGKFIKQNNSYAGQETGVVPSNYKYAGLFDGNTPPTGALDFETGISILKVLKDVNLKYKNTVIVITHNSPIAQMADKVIKMRSGKITEIIINKNPIEPERIEW